MYTRNIKYLILFAAFVIIPFSGFSQLSKQYNKADYQFWQFLPVDSILKNNPPVLIFLHGRSLSGSNLDMVTRYGIIWEIQHGRKIPAIVVAPQVPYKHSWEPDKILSVLNFIQKTYKTDTTRVYMVGMSLGGYGTLYFSGKYPNRITAAVALCGGGNVLDACRLAGIYLWIMHGKKDVAVPISESERMVSAIKKCGDDSKLKYTVYENYDHGDLARVFRQDSIYQWMFSLKK
ncbi:MAG: alpha/beta hydrolase-fold protein [Bacteroidota bacterium]